MILPDKQNFTPKAFTLFIVPFSYVGEWEHLQEQIDWWKPQQEELYSDDVLYPYIMELFKVNHTSQKTRPSLDIYQLEPSKSLNYSKYFFSHILGKKHNAVLAPNTMSSEPHSIPFKFCNEGNNAPHLFISNSSRIGILTFCLDLGSEYKMEDLKWFNYSLQKRDEGYKYLCICPLVPNGENLSDAQVIEETKFYSTEQGFKKGCDDGNGSFEKNIIWDTDFLINSLLGTGSGSTLLPIKYFNQSRIHLFTYCSINDSETPEGKISKEEVIPNLLRLARCIVDRYLLPIESMIKWGAVLQTYENIYFSTAVEGTAMICVAKQINQNYLSKMQDKINRQYFLIYLLVLIQRYTLLDIDQKLIMLEAKRDKTDNELWNMIELMAKTKINCYYTDISAYAHHNQFYHHCCKNLHIPEVFDEISEKVELMKLTLERRMQLLFKEQQKRNKNELEKAEKEKERSNRRQVMLNVIIAILTVTQVVEAVYSLTNRDENSNITIPIVVGCIAILLLFIIIRKDLIASLRNK